MQSQAETLDALMQYSNDHFPKTTRAVDTTLSWAVSGAYLPAKICWKYMLERKYTSFELKNTVAASATSLVFWSSVFFGSTLLPGNGASSQNSPIMVEYRQDMFTPDLVSSDVNSLYVSLPAIHTQR
jgi:hypothetical protein